MTTDKEFCAALDKLNDAMLATRAYLADHPAGASGFLSAELPSKAADKLQLVFGAEYEGILSEKYRLSFCGSDLWLEYWETDESPNHWCSFIDAPVEDLPSRIRVILAPYLPLLIKRADEVLELQTAELEQNVQGIYEALEAAKKNGLPTAKPGKKRK